MERLPEEIVSIILSKLSFRKTCPLKLVSKLWKSIISNPEFIKLQFENYLDSSDDNIRLLILREGSSLVTIDIDFELLVPIKKFNLPTSINSFGPHICGSCNGLVALVYCRHDDPNNHSFYLCNPLIDDHCFSPPQPELPSNKGRYRAVSFGFGYDSINDDYKIVSVNLEGHMRQTRVYSSRANQWGDQYEEHTTDVECFGSPKFEHGILINHTVHWIFYDECFVNKKLRGFDLHLETWVELPLPNAMEEEMELELGDDEGDPGEEEEEFILGSFDERLCVLCNKRKGLHLTGVIIWLMDHKDEYEDGVELEATWTKWLYFSYPHYAFGELVSPPIALDKDGDTLQLLREAVDSNKYNGSHYFWYNWKETTCTYITKFNTYPDFILCNATLVPPPGIRREGISRLTLGREDDGALEDL